MKRRSYLCIAVAALALTMLLASCANENPHDSNTTPIAGTSPAADTTPAATDTVTDAPTVLSVVADSATEFTILRPEKAGSNVISAAVNLRKAIEERTGATLNIVTDWVRPGTEADQSKPEIIIGACERDVSVGLYDSLEPRSFIIQVSGNKLIICGQTEKLTLQAVDYFIENYVNSSFATATSLSLPLDLNDHRDNVKFDMTQLINKNDSYTTTYEKLFDINNVDGYKIMQGGCTDGRYLYMAMENQTFPEGSHHSYIYKYDIATMKQVARSEALPLDHSNDICYNPDTGLLVVVHNAPNRNKISFVDPDTLTVTETRIIGFEIFAISYCQERQQYVIGLSHGQNFAILDTDFKRVFLCTVNSTGYTTQGMECDNDFIYFVQYNQNVIMIYDWEGNLVKRVDMTLTGVEPENICLVDDTFYIGCNNSKWTGGIVYSLKIVKQ